MNELALRRPAADVRLDEALAREFEARLAESATLAFRVAYAVLRHRQDAEDVAQEAMALECEAAALADGRFDLRLAFEQSSLYNVGAKAAAPDESLESRVDNPMLFRTAKSYFNAVLRDGQTTEAVSGADPLTGEVVAIDVTLAVVK